MSIQQQADKLRRIISDANIELLKLKNRCPHPEGTYTYNGNSGNYDPSSDCYWRDYNCTQCGKVWTEYDTLGRGVRNPAYYNAPEGNWREVK